MKKLLCLLMVLPLLAIVPVAGSTADVRPDFKLLRQDEDWSWLRDATVPADPFDALKFIALNRSGSAWLTLGGEVRERYEYYDEANWGRGIQDGNGYFLHRFMVHADAHLGDTFRLFTQFKSGLESDRAGGPRPTDRDDFEVHQLFADARFAPGTDQHLTLRLGRQELSFGSQRLVSVRESPNVRRSFDGVRAIWEHGLWQLSAFAVRPVETKTGVLDDGPDPGAKFWGLYGVAPFPVLPGGRVDLYYLGLERDLARYDQGAAHERRHSVGTRLWGRHLPWDWNFEFVYQFGSFGDDAIAAWTAASDTGFTLASVPWTPRLGVKADVTSGDRDSHTHRLETFYPLFPKGAYFGEAGLIGPMNHIDLHPSVELHPTPAVTFTADADFFWRESTRDGVYNTGLSVVRSGINGGSRYVGAQAAAQIEWRLQRHWKWAANYTHFFAGTFLHENPPDQDVNYFSTWITFRF
jgi:hypothetical protein